MATTSSVISDAASVSKCRNGVLPDSLGRYSGYLTWSAARGGKEILEGPAGVRKGRVSEEMSESPIGSEALPNP